MSSQFCLILEWFSRERFDQVAYQVYIFWIALKFSICWIREVSIPISQPVTVFWPCMNVKIYSWCRILTHESIWTDFRTKKSFCTGRESNSGRPRDRRELYHWATDATSWTVWNYYQYKRASYCCRKWQENAKIDNKTSMTRIRLIKTSAHDEKV